MTAVKLQCNRFLSSIKYWVEKDGEVSPPEGFDSFQKGLLTCHWGAICTIFLCKRISCVGWIYSCSCPQNTSGCPVDAAPLFPYNLGSLISASCFWTAFHVTKCVHMPWFHDQTSDMSSFPFYLYLFSHWPEFILPINHFVAVWWLGLCSWLMLCWSFTDYYDQY